MMTFTIRLCLVFFLSLLLTIVPLPEMLEGFRPSWLLIVVLYLQFFVPAYFNLALIFFLGLCLDTLLSTVLGEHAAALLLTTWIAAGRTRRFSFFSVGQQMMAIILLCSIYQSTLFCIDALMGYHHSLMGFLGCLLLSVLSWPWVCILLDGFLLTKNSSHRRSH